MNLEIRNGEPPGDTLMMTCAIRDIAALRQCTKCKFEFIAPKLATFDVVECPMCHQKKCYRRYQVKMVSAHPQIWENNPHLSDFDKPGMILWAGVGGGIQHANASGLHHCTSHRISLEEKLNITIPQGLMQPQIFFSDEEENALPEIDARYWLVTTSTSGMTAKASPPERWQAVVDALPDITFVHIGLSGDNNPPLTGDNVIDYIGKTDNDIRRLFKLFYHADGSMGATSFQMVIAGALRMPCVIVAGSREPASHHRYPWHRYLDTQGFFVCDTDDTKKYQRHIDNTRACFRCAIDRCPRQVDGYAECLLMVQPEDVVEAIKGYYTGGALEPIPPSLVPQSIPRQMTPVVSVTRPKTFKLVGNAGVRGGGHVSINWILNRMVKEGWRVQMVPTYRTSMPDTYKDVVPGVEITNELTAPCDILMYYANDSIYKLDEGPNQLLAKTQAEKKIMVINYRLGQMGIVEWTKEWDKYIFLCSDLRDSFLERCPGVETMILPPPVDIDPFLKIEIDYDIPLHVVRHSSQGDVKWPKDIEQVIATVKGRRDIKFSFMGYPSFLRDMAGVDKFKAYCMPVTDFLPRGNVFWYLLPDGYYEGGGRIIVEAMSAGLPVVADNRGGSKDYIADGTGWLCNSVEEHIEILSNLSDIKQRGMKAKEYARTHFDPERWLGAIL